MGRKKKPVRGGGDQFELLLQDLHFFKVLAAIWPTLDLPEDLRAAFVAADPAVLPALIDLVLDDPTNEGLNAVGIIMRVDLDDRDDPAKVQAQLQRLREVVAREHSRTVLLRTLVDNHPGTWIQRRIDTIFRAHYLLIDAGVDLVAFLAELEDVQQAIAAIAEGKDGGHGPLLRRLHLRLHGFVAASTTLGDYLAKTGDEIGNDAVADLGQDIRSRPLSALLRELRNHALHEDTLPVKPMICLRDGEWTGAVGFHRDELLTLRSWAKNTDGRSYLEAAEEDTLYLDDLVRDHLEQVGGYVESFIDAVMEARRHVLAEARHFKLMADEATAADFRAIMDRSDN
ncbi:hypothetical protein DVS28_a1091 [Euzebya pacifica]|uniref:Uncharacterized protein n=1 Tax=Euzebya pacifica TaxID=1608957 RepID=A0A346XU95_9ACTN|nr:hypothetical protein [Euzebya pacifica]AXV05792.1 hypothetical protein DVS28_a1091 [Euzebya pacifica]